MQVPNCSKVINKLPNITFTINAAGNKLTITPQQYLGVSDFYLFRPTIGNRSSYLILKSFFYAAFQRRHVPVDFLCDRCSKRLERQHTMDPWRSVFPRLLHRLWFWSELCGFRYSQTRRQFELIKLQFCKFHFSKKRKMLLIGSHFPFFINTRLKMF